MSVARLTGKVAGFEIAHQGRDLLARAFAEGQSVEDLDSEIDTLIDDVVNREIEANQPLLAGEKALEAFRSSAVEAFKEAFELTRPYDIFRSASARKRRKSRSHFSRARKAVRVTYAATSDANRQGK